MPTAQSNALLNKIFKGGARVAGSGRYVVALGQSKSGPCKECQKRAGRHNIGLSGKTPPYHPNCVCHLK